MAISRIKTRLILLFLIVGLIPLFALGFLCIYTNQVIIEEDISSHLETTAHSKMSYIEFIIDEHIDIVEAIASDPYSYHNDVLKSPPNTSQYAEIVEKVTAELMGVRRAHTDILKISIINKDGLVVASTDESALDVDKADVLDILNSDGIYFKDAHMSSGFGVPCIDIGLPIIEDGELLGGVVLDLDLAPIDKLLLDRTGLGETGEVYLINRDGYAFSPLRFRNDTFLSFKVETEYAQHCLDMLRTGEDMQHIIHPQIIALDYHDQNTLAIHIPMPELQWCLLAEIDEVEAFAPVSEMKTKLLLFAIFFSITILILAITQAHIISRPILKLRDDANKISRGYLGEKINTKGKGEIGELARAFDDMRYSLKMVIEEYEKKKAQEELIQQLKESIKKRKVVEEQLRENEARLKVITNSANDAIILIDNNGNISEWNTAAETMFGHKKADVVGKPLHSTIAPKNYRGAYAKAFGEFQTTGKGPAIGKTLELNGLRKNGKEFPLELSLSAVKLKGKWYAIGIIRDISERKKSEKILKRKTTQLERFAKLAVGREEKMIEMKKKLAERKGGVRRKNEKWD